jgi:hypothetical protein
VNDHRVKFSAGAGVRMWVWISTSTSFFHKRMGHKLSFRLDFGCERCPVKEKVSARVGEGQALNATIVERKRTIEEALKVLNGVSDN